MLQVDTDDRAKGVIHASELASGDYCDRAQYFWIVQGEEKKAPHFALQNIFDYGHDAHSKWQNRCWDIGVLAGLFECLACDHRWYAVSPLECAQCHRPRKSLKYKEVDLELTSHLLVGHSDGWIIDKHGEALLEVKTIGEGTVRMNEYALLKKHQYEDAEGKQRLDYKSLWQDIRRPFPSHIRQANIYLHIVRAMEIDIDTMLFIYESKMTQGVKQFDVKYSPEIVGPLLEKCLDMKWHITKQRAPKCPYGGCKKCKPFEENNGKATEHRDNGRDAGAVAPDAAGESGSGEGQPGAARQARRRTAGTAGRPDGTARLRIDDAVHPDRGLVRLLGGATQRRGD